MSGPDTISSSFQREGGPFTEVPNGQKAPSQDQHPTPDTEYYFKNVAFRVGNAVIRVPRNGFEVPGAKFPHSLLPEGEDEISMLQVDEGHFRSFLRAMYPFNGHQLNETDWLGALQLATEWSFLKIRDLSISELDRWLKAQSPKSVILLAKKYHVVEWLHDGYMTLALQDSLTADELRADPALDWETTAKLLSVKLAIMSESRLHLVGVVDSIATRTRIIEKEFKEEFENMRSKAKNL